ncbi:alkaline shock response membrane anchor protein AmaP [Arthrobacter sp. RIT-PI-e]|uniref:alkaline shock response membrane anchor protein AmaP n=1 Tax=Arthrobacter sp. RIT-PI-e TaxID=1681197 RepID=UPI000675E279|nr:alkaline shock response membrane anchor protein AmaP [Arthrobacter sp. RIT-PI-e]
MRETAGALNRTWLAIIGILVLLLGAAGVLLASGLASTLASGAGITTPAPADRALPENFQGVFVPDTAAIIVAVVAIILGLLALGWLLAQIPRRNQARTFRLHADDAADGRTTCEPRVVADAVESEVEQIHGVISAAVLLRGSASQPELTLDVKADQRADIRSIIEQVHTEVVPHLETALETPLRKTAVLMNIGTARNNDKTLVL